MKILNKTIIGGEISKPLNDQENRAIEEIGDSFYDTCEADEQSGKTLWIGIERKGSEWVVSIPYFLHEVSFDNKSHFITIIIFLTVGYEY